MVVWPQFNPRRMLAFICGSAAGNVFCTWMYLNQSAILLLCREQLTSCPTSVTSGIDTGNGTDFFLFLTGGKSWLATDLLNCHLRMSHYWLYAQVYLPVILWSLCAQRLLAQIRHEVCLCKHDCSVDSWKHCRHLIPVCSFFVFDTHCH